MDAKLKKIQITPVKFDKDGDVQKEEFATLTIEVPMDSAGQREAIMELLGHCSIANGYRLLLKGKNEIGNLAIWRKVTIFSRV